MQSVGDLKKFVAVTDHHKADYGNDTNLFTPNTRPDCVIDLYHQGALNPIHTIRTCNPYRNDGRSGSRIFSLSPVLVSATEGGYDDDFDLESKKSVPFEFERTPKEVREVRQRPHSCGTILDVCEQPTPEARIRELSKSQPASLVQIDTSGSGFNRMCQYRESLRASSREYLKEKHHRSVASVPDDVFHEVQDSTFCVKSADDLSTYSASKERWQNHPKTASSEKQINREERGRQSRRREQKERSKSADKMLDEEPQNPMFKRAHSIRQSLKSLFRSKSRSRSRDLWVDKKPVLPGPLVVDIGTTVPRSKSLPRTLKMAVSPQSTSSVETGNDHDTSMDSDEATNTLGLKRKSNKMQVMRIPKSQTPNGIRSTFHGQILDNNQVQKSTEKLSRKPIPVASPTTPSTESLPSVSSSKAGSSQGAPPGYQPSWADVRLRQNNKFKDDRQSSSGNWSGSNSSNRQSMESDYTKSPERRSMVSLDKDSAMSLSMHSPQADDRSTLTDNQDEDLGGTLKANGTGTGNSTLKTRDFTSEKDTKQKHLSTSATESAESTPVIRPKSLAGLTLQNVKAHEYAYQPHGLNRSGVADDESSVYSVDQEGFFTSMHKDSGLSRTYGNTHHETHVRSPSESEHDTSSTLTDMSTLSKSAEKSKKRSFLSKIPGIKKFKNRKSKHSKMIYSPPSVSDSFYMNRSDLNQSDFEFPPPPTESQLNMADSCSSNETLMSSKRSSGISGSRSFNTSDTDIETVYTRLHKKTYINADTFPSMCPVLTGDEEEADSSACSSTFITIARKDKTVSSLEKLVKQLSFDETKTNGDGYSTWPRSPAKGVSQRPEATTPTMDPSKLLDKLDVVHHIDKTVEDLDSKSLASSNSYKSVSTSSERGSKLTFGPPSKPKRVSSSLSSGSGESSSLLSDDIPPDLPPKYQHSVVVRPSEKQSTNGVINEHGHVYANVLMNGSDTTPTKNVYRGHYGTLEVSNRVSLSRNDTESAQDSDPIVNAKHTSTWPRNMKNIVTVSKLKKTDPLDENNPKVQLTSFRPLASPEVKQELHVPASNSEHVRPSSLAISSVSNVMPASAQLIISSPMSNQVSHTENPFKRSMCSPVTDEELNKFGMYNSVDSGFDSLPRKGTVQHSQNQKPPRPQSFHQRVDIPRAMGVSRSQSFSVGDDVPPSPSEPLYPTLESMKHSISYPVTEKARTNASSHGRSWYDGLVTDDQNFRPVSQPLEWIPNLIVGEKRNPPAHRKRQRIHSDSSAELQRNKKPSNKGPFKVGKRSNFGVFQLANNQNGQQMVPKIDFAQSQGNVFNADASTSPPNHSPNKHARKRPSFTSFLRSPTSPTWSTPNAASSPKTPTSPSQTNTFEVLSQMRRDIQLKTTDTSKLGSPSDVNPAFVLSPNGKLVTNPAFEQDRGWGLSTIAEGSESDPEARSVPTSPIARVLLGEKVDQTSHVISNCVSSDTEGSSGPTSPDEDTVFSQTDTGTIKRCPPQIKNNSQSKTTDSHESKSSGNQGKKDNIINNSAPANVNNNAPMVAPQTSNDKKVHGSSQRESSVIHRKEGSTREVQKQGVVTRGWQSKNNSQSVKDKDHTNMLANETVKDKNVPNVSAMVTSKIANWSTSHSSPIRKQEQGQSKQLPPQSGNQGGMSSLKIEKEKKFTAKTPELPPKKEIGHGGIKSSLKPQKVEKKEITKASIADKARVDVSVKNNVDNVQLSKAYNTAQLSTDTGPLLSKTLEAKPPKVPQGNTKLPSNSTSSKTDTAQTDAKKSFLLPKLRQFKPAEVKYSWTSAKKGEEVSKNNATNISKSDLKSVNVNNKIISLAKCATSPRPRSNTNEELKDSDKSSVKSMGGKQQSKSTVSLTNTGGYSPGLSIANKNKSARMAFLSSDQDIHQSSKVDSRFARYTLGKSTTSLNSSTASLKTQSKSTEV